MDKRLPHPSGHMTVLVVMCAALLFLLAGCGASRTSAGTPHPGNAVFGIPLPTSVPEAATPTPPVFPDAIPTPSPDAFPTPSPDAFPTPSPDAFPTPSPDAFPTPSPETALSVPSFDDIAESGAIPPQKRTAEPVTVDPLMRQMTEADGTKTPAHEPRGRQDIRAVYLTGWTAGNNLEPFLDLLDNTELNAVVIDIREGDGRIAYPTDVAVFRDNKGFRHDYDPVEVLAKLHERDIWVIGRIVCFKDAFLPKLFPDLAIQKKGGRPAGTQGAERIHRTLAEPGERRPRGNHWWR